MSKYFLANVLLATTIATIPLGLSVQAQSGPAGTPRPTPVPPPPPPPPSGDPSGQPSRGSSPGVAVGINVNDAFKTIEKLAKREAERKAKRAKAREDAAAATSAQTSASSPVENPQTEPPPETPKPDIAASEPAAVQNNTGATTRIAAPLSKAAEVPTPTLAKPEPVPVRVIFDTTPTTPKAVNSPAAQKTKAKLPQPLPTTKTAVRKIQTAGAPQTKVQSLAPKTPAPKAIAKFQPRPTKLVADKPVIAKAGPPLPVVEPKVRVAPLDIQAAPLPVPTVSTPSAAQLPELKPAAVTPTKPEPKSFLWLVVLGILALCGGGWTVFAKRKPKAADENHSQTREEDQKQTIWRAKGAPGEIHIEPPVFEEPTKQMRLFACVVSTPEFTSHTEFSDMANAGASA